MLRPLIKSVDYKGKTKTLPHLNILLGLSFVCAFELHAACGTDAHFCPVEPLSPELEAQVLALQKQSEEKVAGLLQDSSDLLRNDSSEGLQSLLVNDKTKALSARSEPRLYVFVSLSLPEASLIELGKQAKKIDGVLVLRGLKDASFKKTAQAFKAFIEKTGYGLIIDPMLFKTFEVTTAPTFVIAQAQPSCPQNSSCPAPAYDKLSGHVSLEYALRELACRGEFSLAKKFLTRLRENGS